MSVTPRVALICLLALPGCRSDREADAVTNELGRLKRDALERESDRLEREIRVAEARRERYEQELARALERESAALGDLRRVRERLLELEAQLVDLRVREEAAREARASKTNDAASPAAPSEAPAPAQPAPEPPADPSSGGCVPEPSGS